MDKTMTTALVTPLPATPSVNEPASCPIRKDTVSFSRNHTIPEILQFVKQIIQILAP